MKFDSFNPFKPVMNEGYFPHSRALHTGFSDKLFDAFIVFLALFDYPTLGVFFLVTELKDFFRKVLKTSSHDITSKFSLIRMSVEKGQEIDLNNLKQISINNNYKPI